MSVSKKNFFSDLTTLTEIIYNVNKNNINTSISSLCKFYDNSQTYSFNLIICRFIYTMFVAKLKDIDIIIEFLNLIEREINKNQVSIIDIFSRFLQENNTQESNYLIGKLIEKGLINSSITENMKSLFSSHFKAHFVLDNRYQFSEYFSKNLEKLQANDWELHKKYVKEGINPNEIVKIIRNDEIEKLQEILSQPNFDFNQTIEPSLYERCSFINKENVSLIDYAAFFGSVKCFKYLLMNGAKLDNTGKYAVADGNEEIIHLCEQNHSSFESTYEIAIEFHRNNIFKYLNYFLNKKELISKLKIFVCFIWKFKIIFGNYLNYLKQHLFMHLDLAIQKLLNYFLNKKEMILMLKIFICFILYLF